jgi:hypothetical protein
MTAMESFLKVNFLKKLVLEETPGEGATAYTKILKKNVEYDVSRSVGGRWLAGIPGIRCSSAGLEALMISQGRKFEVHWVEHVHLELNVEGRPSRNFWYAFDWDTCEFTGEWNDMRMVWRGLMRKCRGRKIVKTLLEMIEEEYDEVFDHDEVVEEDGSYLDSDSETFGDPEDFSDSADNKGEMNVGDWIGFRAAVANGCDGVHLD